MVAEGAFQDRVALVTGGGTGLGLAIATRLGRGGASVVCASRDAGHHEELLRRGEEFGFKVRSRAMDVRKPDEVREVVRGAARDLGGIDVLVNNAAGNFIRPSMSLAPKGFATVIDIALNGVFTVSREVGRVMQKTGGSIVNISAPYAVMGQPGVIHSACAKAGVESMTRTLANEWAGYGIRVNAVSPGPFHSRGAADRLWPNEQLKKDVEGRIPLGRFGDVSEVARVVCFLASDEADWVTGAVWPVTGGCELPKPLMDPDSGPVRRRREDS